MNTLPFGGRQVSAVPYGAAPEEGKAALRVDLAGRPVLTVGATQTIGAASLDIRSLSAALDTAGITASAFDIRALNSGDSVTAYDNAYTVSSGSQTLLLGGTVVLTVDTSPYARSAFLVRVDSLSLLTTANLQLAPVNTSGYFETVASQSSLALGGVYVFVPDIAMKYARIFATGVGSVLTAYYVGQA
ncbi:MAG: hypothetical protein AAGU77_12925 [Bacillota bacterium]